MVAGTKLQSSANRARAMTTESSFKDAFTQYADYLNDLNAKRERVVKASRDITINSKKVIFQVHRIGKYHKEELVEKAENDLTAVKVYVQKNCRGLIFESLDESDIYWSFTVVKIGKYNKEEVVEKAENDLTAVKDQYMSRLVKELHGTDFWKLRRAYSPGVQEYVEAATFCKFCKTGSLLSLDELNATLLPLSDPSLEPLQINVLDYLLGLADLTGELMRLAIGRISDGELEFAEKICGFVRDVYRELTLLVPEMDDNSDMKTKMDTMLQSVVKIENACFSVHVRGSEYVPLIGSSDPNYSLLGVPEHEP